MHMYSLEKKSTGRHTWSASLPLVSRILLLGYFLNDALWISISVLPLDTMFTYSSLYTVRKTHAYKWTIPISKVRKLFWDLYFSVSFHMHACGRCPSPINERHSPKWPSNGMEVLAPYRCVSATEPFRSCVLIGHVFLREIVEPPAKPLRKLKILLTRRTVPPLQV